jgi:hypothetical protein
MKVLILSKPAMADFGRYVEVYIVQRIFNLSVGVHGQASVHLQAADAVLSRSQDRKLNSTRNDVQT